MEPKGPDAISNLQEYRWSSSAEFGLLDIPELQFPGISGWSSPPPHFGHEILVPVIGPTWHAI